LDPEQVQLAVNYRSADNRLSLPDAFALALAKSGGHVLLAGHANLRSRAEAKVVVCHRVLWVLDELELDRVVGPKLLHAVLTRISQHPRRRLPKGQIGMRLSRWRQ